MSITAHPDLPEFEYIQPNNAMEASRFLAEHAKDARPLLGGTDIFVRMRDGFYHEKYLVDVKCLEEAQCLFFEPVAVNGNKPGLTLGAAVNMNRSAAYPPVRAHYPLLAEACRWVASYQLRTRATIAGNICNASPAGDTIGACLALEALLNVHGTDGPRQIPLEGFFQGPGRTLLKAGDIVTSIFFPLPPPGGAGAYIKLGRNNWGDLSIVGVTAYASPDAGLKSGWRFWVVLASVAPIPLVVHQAQEYLAEHAPSPQTFEQAARLAADSCNPIDDVRGSARYRKAMVRRLTEKALQTTWQRLNTGES